MNAREVIADELRRLGSFMPDEETDNILFRLSIRGFTITSKEDVEAVRDKALEEAAVLVEQGKEERDPLDNFQSTFMADWDDMEDLAAAIRSLKSTP